MRNSSVLLIFTLVSLQFMCFSCQNEGTQSSNEKLSEEVKQVAVPLAVSNKQEEDVKNLPAEENELPDEAESPTGTTNADEKSSESDEGDLLEFYVKEDKESKKKSEERKKAEAEKNPETASSTKEKTESKAPVKKKSSSKKVAKMKFDSEVFKFGIIKPGDVIEHKFEFTNTGNKDLVIKDAQASCGCTQPSFPFIPIKPGEKGYIGVKYDSKGKLGQQKPMVTLTTNGSPATKKIYLEGLVISEMAKN